MATNATNANARTVPVLLTVSEVAATLRLSRATVYRAIERGDLAAVRLGSRDGCTLRIRADELARLLGSGGEEPSR